MTLWTGLFLGEHGVRFDPCVGLVGGRFGVEFALGVGTGIHGGSRLVTTWTGGLPM